MFCHRSTPALSLALALAVAAVAGCTPSTGASATATPAAAATTAASPVPSADVTATVKVLDFKLEPSTLTVSGSTLALAVSNDGPTVHNVTVRDSGGDVLFGTRDLRDGESETVTHAIAPGTYVLYCSLPGHESLGIKGTLTVTAP